MRKLDYNDKRIDWKTIGRFFKVGAKGIVFASDDPNITLKLKDRKQLDENRLTLTMKVTLIPAEMGRNLQDKMSMKRFF